MYTRVASSLVGFAVARVDIVVEKFVPGFAKVSPAMVWVERYEELLWPATTPPLIECYS